VTPASCAPERDVNCGATSASNVWTVIVAICNAVRDEIEEAEPVTAPRPGTVAGLSATSGVEGDAAVASAGALACAGGAWGGDPARRVWAESSLKSVRLRARSWRNPYSDRDGDAPRCGRPGCTAPNLSER
jgi:hypothetical protein